MASEAALNLLALTIVVLCLLGTVVGFVAVARAWRRLRLYREPGSRRAYARQQLFLTLSRLAMTVLFLATGLVISIMAESDLRSGIARLLVLAVVVILVGLQVLDPIAQSRIEYLRSQEVEDGREDA